MMRRVLLVFSLSSLYAGAVTLDVAQLPDPVFADTEVSADAALPGNRFDGLRVFRLELTFMSTPSNNVQVSFGRDNRPADGKLAAEETDFIVGWDCGEWFLRPQGLKVRHAVPAAVTNGTRMMTASIRVSEQGVPQSVTFKDGAAAFAFEGLVLTPFPGWLNPELWDHLRVTVRGSSPTNDTVKAVFAPDGARITVK